MLYLTRQQVREIDRLSTEQYHIPSIVLMENASRGAADLATEMLGSYANKNILILAGGGNNGGDGLATARHLHNRGFQVTIGMCTDPGRYTGDALVNWAIVRAMSLPIIPAAEGWPLDLSLIIDAIFGIGLTRPPRPDAAAIIHRANESKIPILAIDLPSGLDCDTGEPLGVCIGATQTVTFVAQKAGFANPSSKSFTGRVTVADIGSPRQLTDQFLISPR